MTRLQHPAATQPATAIDKKTLNHTYGLDQPAVAQVTAVSFDRLWNAFRDAIVADGFTLDRRDYREGLLTTVPLVSKSSFEFWRNDVVDDHSLAQSTLGTVRRTVRVQVQRQPDGSYQATPKVLVERYSMIQRRITSVAQYRDIFSITLQDVARDTEEAGQAIPAEYWYPIARDHALERQLAQSAKQRLPQAALVAR